MAWKNNILSTKNSHIRNRNAVSFIVFVAREGQLKYFELLSNLVLPKLGEQKKAFVKT